jgi:flagellar biosynthesis protein FlhB
MEISGRIFKHCVSFELQKEILSHLCFSMANAVVRNSTMSRLQGLNMIGSIRLTRQSSHSLTTCWVVAFFLQPVSLVSVGWDITSFKPR